MRDARGEALPSRPRPQETAMSASGESNTQQESAHGREAVDDMRERLAQVGRLVGQVRDGSPQQHDEALDRIQEGIESLTERISALRHGEEQLHDHPDAHPTLDAGARAEADNPWDPHSAEELMRAYEAAESESARAGHARSTPRYRHWPQETAAQQTHALPPHDAAWLDARFADIAALLHRVLAEKDPMQSLAAMGGRLDQFERRLDGALSEMTLSADREGIYQIDAHVGELAGHLEAMREQLGRLDVMDDQLRALARNLEEHAQSHAGGPAIGNDAIAALIDSAAERAASRAVASLPAGSPERVAALEGVLQDYITERRRGDEVTTGIFNTIEGALLRILDRVEAIESVRLPAAAPGESEPVYRGDTQGERDLLAEAYAEGARLLGQQGMEPSLHAADYLTGERREPRVAAAATEIPPPAPIDQPEPEEVRTRQELRASALRAKLKAQGTAQEPAAPAATADDTSLDEAKAGMLGHGRIRTWTSARSGSQRFSLLLGGAMALLFGTGFMAVDSLLGSTPPAGTQQRSVPETQPVGWTGAGEPKQRPGGGALQQPMPQPAQRRPAPEAATDGPAGGQPAPTRRLDRIQSGTASAAPIGPTQVMLPPQEDEIAAPPAPVDDSSDTLPESIGTAKLRQAALAGDAFAQFEVATRFAEGKGVPQDHTQAFTWYERAATRGLASAQFRLAAYFERGVGTAVDKERARVWYMRAAEQGYIRAMHNLGVLTVGSGERQADYAAAARWFGQAAERGLADSQFNLAILYENGRGVPKDLQEAYKWFALAARSGDPVAARRLDQVRARMEPGEIDAAEQKVAAWRSVASDPPTGSIAARVRR
jgi:localization factor PodJL